MDDLAYWIVECGYGIDSFGDPLGIGITNREVGGCWGVLAPDLIRDMREKEFLADEGHGNVSLTFRGLHALQQCMARRWMATQI